MIHSVGESYVIEVDDELTEWQQEQFRLRIAGMQNSATKVPVPWWVPVTGAFVFFTFLGLLLGELYWWRVTP